MAILGIALFLFFCPPLAQSQPPSPRPPKVAQGNKDKATPEQPKSTPDQKATEEFSALVDKVATEVARRNQQQSARNPKQESSPDWWGRASTVLITLFTGVLAYLAYLQWRAMDQQAMHMRDGLVETTKAANAAKEAADTAKRSLEVSQRANVGIVEFVLVDDPDRRAGMQSDFLQYGWIEISIRNTGSTRACAFSFDYTVTIEGEDVLRYNTAPAAPYHPIRVSTTPTDLHPGFTEVIRSSRMMDLFPNIRIYGWDYVVFGRNLRVSGSFSYRSIFGEGLSVAYEARVDASKTPTTEDPKLLSGFEIINSLRGDAQA